MTPNLDNSSNRHHDLDDVPEPDDLPGTISTGNDTTNSIDTPSTLDDFGGRSDALGG